jgi:hypothetical protein
MKMRGIVKVQYHAFRTKLRGTVNFMSWPLYPSEGTAVHSEQETEWELAELDAVKETSCSYS